jgi:CBS domain containing-hemolysin-like protein/mannitol/fructose-specific phosphotransferase system IIA component
MTLARPVRGGLADTGVPKRLTFARNALPAHARRELVARSTGGLIALYLSAVVACLALNAFFALAEFAAVKMRPTRVRQLAEGGDPRALALAHIKSRIDEYLSVCQVGMTSAAIGLGFLGEPAIANGIQSALEGRVSLSPFGLHALAIGATYVLVSYVVIVVAELVPKTIALHSPERAALLCARALRLCYTLFYVPLVALNRSARAVLWAIGLRRAVETERLSEEELRLAMAESQKGGELSFRQLLTIENVLLSSRLTVADAMKLRSGARVLSTSVPWEDNLRMLQESRLSRLPLIDPSQRLPVGVVHVKDVFYGGQRDFTGDDLRRIARPCAVIRETQPLQDVLAELQKRRVHWAAVTNDQNVWTGFITLEDVMEEFVGAVEDEFEVEPPTHLADALTPGRVVLELEASSIEDAVTRALAAVPPAELPFPARKISAAVIAREADMPTYLGRGVAVPHARLDGLDKPVLVFARSTAGIPAANRSERTHLFFILLTSPANPRVQARLLSRIGGLLDNASVERRLREADSPSDIADAIRDGELAVLG